MLGLETLDILIGLITVYLTFALACTALVEALVSCLGRRQRYLERAINEIFYAEQTAPLKILKVFSCWARGSAPDRKFSEEFWRHPLIFSLSCGATRPSYISPAVFVEVVDDLIAKFPEAQWPPVIRELVRRDPGSSKPAIEAHFNAVMQRATGWFKRHTQLVTMICATALVLVANVDTVELIRQFSLSPATRVKLVELAQQRLEHGDAVTDQAALKTKDLPEVGITLGWQAYVWPAQASAPERALAVLLKLCGLLVSMLAISLGAPFWFDSLNRVVNIRGSGVQPKAG